MAKDAARRVDSEATKGLEEGQTGRPTRRRIVRRRVNGRFLLILLAVLVVVGVGTHFVHRAMVDGNAIDIRDRAAAAEKAGDFPEAIGLYTQYRKFEPGDVDATIALADLLRRESDSGATWQRVYDLLETALRQDATRDEVRRPLIEAAIELEQFSDANVHVDYLLEQQAAGEIDSELLALKAEVQEGLQRYAEAGAFYIRAIQADPSRVEPYAALARILTDNPDAIRPLMSEASDGSAADGAALTEVVPGIRAGAGGEQVGAAITDLMVVRAQPTWRALMERARYRRWHGDISGAIADTRTALDDPAARESAKAVFSAAQIELAAIEDAGSQETAAEHRAAAEQLARMGVDSELDEPRLHLILAESQLFDGGGDEDLAQAVELLETGVVQAKELRATARGDEAVRLLEAEIELRWYLANYRIEAADDEPDQLEPLIQETNESIELLQMLGCRRELTDFLAVRLQMARGEWPEAAQTLETLRLRVMDMPAVRRRVDGMLAAAYGALENPDRQIGVFRRALSEDPLWISARIGLAESLVEAGRMQEALQNYLAVLEVGGVPQRLARLVTTSELQGRISPEDLEEIRKIIKTANTKNADNPTTDLLAIELLLAQGDFARAETELAALAERFPESTVVWRARVGFAAIRGDQPRDERIRTTRALIETGKKQFGDIIATRVAQAELAQLENDPQFAQTLIELAETPESFSSAERIRLLQNLAAVARRAGDMQAGRMLWMEIAEARPKSLSPWLRVAEYAVDGRDESAVASALARIREIEGPTGPNGDFIAAYEKIMQATTDAALHSNPTELAEYLAEPRTMLARAAEARPYWANIPRAQGVLESLAGDDEAAVEFFEQAWQLGDRTAAVTMALVKHYQTSGQVARAEQILREIEGSGALADSPQIRQLSWQLRLAEGDIDGALAITRSRAEQTKSVGDRITHANLLRLKYRSLSEEDRSSEAGRGILEKSRAMFASIVDSNPRDADGWLAYVSFLRDIGESDAAGAIIERASTEMAEAPAGVRLLTLARCHAVLGDTEQAKARFLEAVDSDPKNVETRMAAADYLSRVGDLESAQQQVDWILDPANGASDSSRGWARRRSAFILAASRGRHEDVLKAIDMLRGDAKTGQASVDDLRAQVALLAGRGISRDRRLMLSILEQIEQQAELSPDEKFQMVALYEMSDQWSKAKSLLEDLRTADEENPQYLAAYIVGTARHEPATESVAKELRPLLEALESAEPDSLRTALTRAEFEKQFGTIEKAGATLASYVESFKNGASRGGDSITDAERQEIADAASAAEEMGAGESALALYRRLAEASPRPEDSMPLAMYLGRLARYQEALELLETLRPKLEPDAVAVTAVNIVSLGAPEREQIARVEEFVTQALREMPDSPRIGAALAGLRSVQGRYDDAEKIYRQVLKKHPNNAATLNNLAWLLMVAGKDIDEAARLIDEAIAVAGPAADLVDTRGTIDLARGNVDEALADLREAFQVSPSISIGFHLAIALERLGREEEARAMFREVREMGLDINQLHPSEHAAYQELAEKFSDS